MNRCAIPNCTGRIFRESQCHLCTTPKSELKKIFSDSETERIFLSVFSKIVSDKCAQKCLYRNEPVSQFNSDFIRYLVKHSNKICVLDRQIIYSRKKKFQNVLPQQPEKKISDEIRFTNDISKESFDVTENVFDQSHHLLPLDGNGIDEPIHSHGKNKVSNVDYKKLIDACINNNSSNLSKREKQEFGKIRTVYRALIGIGKQDSITSRYIRGMATDIHPTHVSVIRRYLPLLIPYLPQDVVKNLKQVSEDIYLITDNESVFAVVDSIEKLLIFHGLPMHLAEILLQLKGDFSAIDINRALDNSNKFVQVGDFYDIFDRWKSTSYNMTFGHYK